MANRNTLPEISGGSGVLRDALGSSVRTVRSKLAPNRQLCDADAGFPLGRSKHQTSAQYRRLPAIQGEGSLQSPTRNSPNRCATPCLHCQGPRIAFRSPRSLSKRCAPN